MNLVSKLSTAIVRPLPEQLKKLGTSELVDVLKTLNDPDEKSLTTGRYTFCDIDNIAGTELKSITAGGFVAFALRCAIKKASPAQIKLYAEQLAWERYQKRFTALKRRDRIELMDAARDHKTKEAPVSFEAMPVIFDYATDQILIPSRPAHLFHQATKRLLVNKETGDVAKESLQSLCVPMLSVRMLFRNILDKGYFGDRDVVMIRSIKTSAWYKLNVSTSDKRTSKELGHLLEKIKEEAPDAEVEGLTFTVPFQGEKSQLTLTLGHVQGFPRLSVAIPGKTHIDTAVAMALLADTLLRTGLTEVKKELDEAQV